MACGNLTMKIIGGWSQTIIIVKLQGFPACLNIRGYPYSSNYRSIFLATVSNSTIFCSIMYTHLYMYKCMYVCMYVRM